ncbi:conserved hypothetical protein [Cenarchaeum symbiosum A]|uniref:Uncharacterized protein n=1 Tax=Cenarchaeum symbiosum (strain A) TaxID=414004 RepID=A0RX25_CENSY|nr:conserved hypothetical protein [Cenarchaeum symbiosum A]
MLQRMAAGRVTGKSLAFGAPHLLKAIQLLEETKYVSRGMMAEELHLGEGSTRTLLGRLGEQNIADSIRSGAYLTEEGGRFARKIQDVMPGECGLPHSPLPGGESSHAVMLRGCAGSVRSGVEQRDYAVMYGAGGAMTLVYKGGRYTFPDGRDAAFPGGAIQGALSGLGPIDGDVLIIAAAGDSFTSEMAAKNSGLLTVQNGTPRMRRR